MQMLKEKAFAKINLAIDVLGKREDGYHEVEMVMQTLSLHDELHALRVTDGQISLISDMHITQNPEDNLIVRAARLLQERFRPVWGVQLSLKKRIPMEAGLGGGSADAAAALRLLVRLWEISVSREELLEMAALLGADVPFLLAGGTAWASQKGEKIESLPSLPTMEVLLIKPPFGVPTPSVYALYDQEEVSPRYASRALKQRLEMKPDQPIALEEWKQYMHNDLQTVCVRMYPVLQELLEEITKRGGAGMMSGSGPTLWAVFPTRDVLEEASQFFENRGNQCFITSTQCADFF